ncbi:MAG: zinc ribbon domain-containing protein [Bacilli bacterium]|nr:zinc ribbon domain-containing protein [Bacilli bacterium]
MFCKNCGSKLDGDFCSKCGTKNESTAQSTNLENEMNASKGESSEEIKPIISSSASSTVADNSTSLLENVGNISNVNSNQGQVTTDKKSGSGAKVAIIVIVAIFGLAVLGAGGFFGYKFLKDHNSSKGNDVYTPDEEVNTTGTTGDNNGTTGGNNGTSGGNNGTSGGNGIASSNTVSYGGFEFVVPNGYNYKIDNQYGLMVYSNDIAFSVLADFTNSFENYKNAFLLQYPNLTEKDILLNLNGRDYLLVALKDESTNEESLEYVTAALGGSPVFVGVLANSKATEPTSAEFKIVSDFLESAKTKGSSFAKGDKDPGENGPILYEKGVKLPVSFK